MIASFQKTPLPILEEDERFYLSPQAISGEDVKNILKGRR